MVNKNEITLPYDFIPFANEYFDEFYTPYTYESLPKFNAPPSPERLSGTITYNIEPHGDLVLESRETLDGQVYLSGSQIRGKVRSNVEILSGSYPVFVDRSEMLYRNITDTKSSYHQKLKGQKEDGSANVPVEEAVRAGYLQRIDNDYFIVPAKCFGRKNFLAIKEHWLINQGVLDQEHQLFLWHSDGDSARELNERFQKIEQLNEKIKTYRDQLHDKWNDNVRRKWSEVFLQRFNFNKNENMKRIKLKKKQDPSLSFPKLCEMLDETVSMLKGRLNEVVRSDASFNNLIAYSTERWRLKAEMDIYYRHFMRNNNRFEPYQEPRFFDLAYEENVRRMTRSGDGGQLSGTLFCSSNAASKRSHYLINEQDNSQERIRVPQDVIYAYNKQHEKMRFNKKGKQEKTIHDFYNLFNERNAYVPKIVFFQHFQDENKKPGEEKQLLCIGRTPHFKIPYDHQISRLLDTTQSQKLDYTRALFGFTEVDVFGLREDPAETQAYKSRIRFGPAVLIGACPEPIIKEFLLPSPSATSEGMYIHPGEGSGRASYEKNSSIGEPVLNGHKYYHVVSSPIRYFKTGTTDKMETPKKVLQVQKPGTFHFEGKIYFSNVTPDELGLLILGLDIAKLLHSVQFKKEVYEYKDKLQQVFELIGGAKPYGYGKVKINVESMQIERNSTDFESLIIEPETSVYDYGAYIDHFLGRMETHLSYLQHDLLNHYISSKQIRSFRDDDAQHLDWSKMSNSYSSEKNKSVGYPRDSYLKSRFSVRRK